MSNSLTVLSSSQVHVANPGDTIHLQCLFLADNFNLFHYPVLWRKTQLHEDVQVGLPLVPRVARQPVRLSVRGAFIGTVSKRLNENLSSIGRLVCYSSFVRNCITKLLLH